MPVSLSGVNLEDPKRLRDDLRQSGLPVGEWSVRCHSFVSPCEREPGVGHVLIRRSAWDRIPDKTSLTLTFADSFGSSVSFVKLHPVSSPTPLAVPTATSDAILWLTLEDRRSRYKQVATSRSYNLRLAAGGWDTATLNSGTAFTWAQIVADLWAKLKAVYTDLPSSAPSLPSTPSGTPESFSFYSVDAWTALCTVCQAAGFLVRYDPTTDAVSIINPADAVSVEPIQTQWSRTWDTRSGQLIPEAVPANFQLSFPRLGRPERHQISTTISETGVTTGATVTLPAYPSAAGDPVSNTTYLTAFTGRMRDFWRRDLAARSEPRAVQYKGWHPWVKTAVGLSGYASWGVSQLAGDEVQTSLTSGPLLVLPPGEPTPSLSAEITTQQASVSSSGFTLTASSLTWEDVTGLSITVAQSGLHLVMFSLSGFIATANPGSTIVARLRQTGSSSVNHIQRYVCWAPVGGTGAGFTQGGGAGTAAGQATINLVAGDVVRVQVMRSFSGTVHTSIIPGAGLDGLAAHLTIVKID